MIQENKEGMALNELLLDHAPHKYTLISYALRWPKELKKKQDAPKTTQELLNKALHDILTDKVSYKEIDKLSSSKEAKKDEQDAGSSDKDGKKKS